MIRAQKETENWPSNSFVLDNGEPVVLTLHPKSGSGNFVIHSAMLGVGPQEIAQVLACFQRNSGLE